MNWRRCSNALILIGRRAGLVCAPLLLCLSMIAQSSASRGQISLEGCSCDITPESKYGLSACFELNSPLQSRLYALACDSQEDMQLWINFIRKCMLKIRRQKAKEQSKQKRLAVEGAAQQSQQAQQQREQQAASQAQAQAQTQQSAAYAPPSTAAAPGAYSSAPAAAAASPPHGYASAPSSQPQHAQPLVHPSAASNNGAYNSSSGGAMSQEDKYTVYRQWLDETKAKKQGGGSAAGGGAGRGSVAGGELHHTLLDEDSENKSTLESWCSCCPVWCFR